MATHRLPWSLSVQQTGKSGLVGEEHALSVWQFGIKIQKIKTFDKLRLSALSNRDWRVSPSAPPSPVIWGHYFWLDETRRAVRGKVGQWWAVKILMTELDQTPFFPPTTYKSIPILHQFIKSCLIISLQFVPRLHLHIVLILTKTSLHVNRSARRVVFMSSDR